MSFPKCQTASLPPRRCTSACPSLPAISESNPQESRQSGRKPAMPSKTSFCAFQSRSVGVAEWIQALASSGSPARRTTDQWNVAITLRASCAPRAGAHQRAAIPITFLPGTSGRDSRSSAGRAHRDPGASPRERWAASNPAAQRGRRTTRSWRRWRPSCLSDPERSWPCIPCPAAFRGSTPVRAQAPRSTPGACGAPDERAGSDQQDHRQRHLRLRGAPCAAARACTAPSFRVAARSGPVA